MMMQKPTASKKNENQKEAKFRDPTDINEEEDFKVKQNDDDKNEVDAANDKVNIAKDDKFKNENKSEVTYETACVCK